MLSQAGIVVNDGIYLVSLLYSMKVDTRPSSFINGDIIYNQTITGHN